MVSIMLNCKEYSELVSKGLDKPLSLWEKVIIKMHALVCPPCDHVEDQFKTLAEACRHLPSDEAREQNESSVLPEDTCTRIKAALRKARENSGA